MWVKISNPPVVFLFCFGLVFLMMMIFLLCVFFGGVVGSFFVGFFSCCLFACFLRGKQSFSGAQCNHKLGRPCSAADGFTLCAPSPGFQRRQLKVLQQRGFPAASHRLDALGTLPEVHKWGQGWPNAPGALSAPICEPSQRCQEEGDSGCPAEGSGHSPSAPELSELGRNQGDLQKRGEAAA